MDYIVNDRSLHGQFVSLSAFVEALQTVLALRARLRRSGRVLHVLRGVLHAPIAPKMTLRQAIGSISDKNLRAVATTWIANEGPFWDDERLHEGDEWFEDRRTKEIVTDTGLGEAAMAVVRGLARSLISFNPSDWTYSPVEIDHVVDTSLRRTIALDNHWAVETLERQIEMTRRPLGSWDALVRWAREECPRLSLTPDVIQWLDGYAFIPGAAQRFQVLLSTLDKLKGSFDAGGSLTQEGNRILQNHFVGNKAWFTDSSDSEKVDFKDELTFPNPDPSSGGKTIFCPWHGKVKIEQMRVHFTYPIRHDRPLYIVYIGPKLTKR